MMPIEEAGKERLEAQRREHHAGDDQAHRARVVEVAEAVRRARLFTRQHEQHDPARQRRPRSPSDRARA